MRKILLTAALVFLAGCSKQQENQGNSENMTQPVVASEEDKAKDEKVRLINQIQSIPTLKEAIQLSVGMWEDAYNTMPPAAMLIPLWAEKNTINLSMINAIPTTSYGRIMKDSVSERGKSLCISGMVGDIAVDRSAGFPVYSGAIVNTDRQIVRYLAMKSTGDIVDGSMSKFCGIIVGKMSYDNAQGGTTHAAYLVGMFDLPENR